MREQEKKKSIFQDLETVGLILHIETAKISDLRDALDSIEGLKIIYQRKRESGKLYISEEPPKDLQEEESEEEVR